MALTHRAETESYTINAAPVMAVVGFTVVSDSAAAVGKLITATVPLTGCVAGKLPTETVPLTGCVTGKFSTATVPETIATVFTFPAASVRSVVYVSSVRDGVDVSTTHMVAGPDADVCAEPSVYSVLGEPPPVTGIGPSTVKSLIWFFASLMDIY